MENQGERKEGVLHSGVKEGEKIKRVGGTNNVGVKGVLEID